MVQYCVAIFTFCTTPERKYVKLTAAGLWCPMLANPVLLHASGGQYPAEKSFIRACPYRRRFGSPFNKLCRYAPEVKSISGVTGIPPERFNRHCCSNQCCTFCFGPASHRHEHSHASLATCANADGSVFAVVATSATCALPLH